MSVSRTVLRAVVVLALTTGAGAALTRPAQADASPSPSAGVDASPSVPPGTSPAPAAPDSADPAPTPSDGVPAWPLSATYRLRPTTVGPGQDVTLIESDVVGDDSPPVFIFRYVNWGDGTPEQFFSTADRPEPHRYARSGTYRVSVRLQNLDQTAQGTFPDGNTVTVRVAPTSPPPAGRGGGLPVTGPGAGWVAAIGAGVLLAGLVAVVAFRRRRVRFVG